MVAANIKSEGVESIEVKEFLDKIKISKLNLDKTCLV